MTKKSSNDIQHSGNTTRNETPDTTIRKEYNKPELQVLGSDVADGKTGLNSERPMNPEGGTKGPS